MTEEQIAGVEGFSFKVGAVAWNEQPMMNLVSQKLDGAEGRELTAEGWIGRIGDVGEDKPNAVVLGRFRVVAEHTNDPVAEVDGEAGEHATHLGLQGSERFEDEGIRGLLFGFRGAGHGLLQGT